MFPTRVVSMVITIPPKYRKVVLTTQGSSSLEDNKLIVMFKGTSGKIPGAGF